MFGSFCSNLEMSSFTPKYHVRFVSSKAGASCEGGGGGGGGGGGVVIIR